jgi:hypothetical protein
VPAPTLRRLAWLSDVDDERRRFRHDVHVVRACQRADGLIEAREVEGRAGGDRDRARG